MCEERKLALKLCKKYNLTDLYNYISDEENNLEKIFNYIRNNQSEQIVQAILESKNDEWKYYYCRYIEDRQELWSTISRDVWIYHYCRYIEDRQELWPTITDDYWIYIYCQNINDREELSSTITNKYWKKKHEKWKMRKLKCVQIE